MDQETPEYLTWQDAGRTRTVRIEHEVIRRIHTEVMRGFGVTRRRGTEPGGLLLGRLDDGAIVIDDFRLVPCEYAFGPSYVLSSADEAVFAETVAEAGAEAIGYFRSHTRDGLTTDQADSGLFVKFFGGAGKVALLLKPFATKPPAASLFFPEADGSLKPGEPPREFTFSTRVESIVAEPYFPAPAAEAQVPASDTVDGAAPALVVPVLVVPSQETTQGRRLSDEQRVLENVLGPRPEFVTEEESAPAARAGGGRSRGFLTLVAAICFAVTALAAGFVSGFQVAGGHIVFWPEPRLSPPEKSDAFKLQLRARTAGDRVHVQWATDSIAARMASGATVYIRDGNETRVVSLQPGEVRDGTILHLPQTDSIRFRLELNLPDERLVSERVDWKR